MYEVTVAEEYVEERSRWSAAENKRVTYEVPKIRFGGKQLPLPGFEPWHYEHKGVALRNPKAALVVTGLDLLTLTRAGGRAHE
jgi:hypothetical protein